MATKLAEYKFTNEAEFEGVKGRIFKELCSDYNYWTKIEFSVFSYGEGFVRIYDECSNPSLAGQICRTFGGVPYNS
jgi:hypothetical protein